MMKVFKALVVAVLSLGIVGCGAGLTGLAEKSLYPFDDVDKNYPVGEQPPEGYEQRYFSVEASDGTDMQIHAWYHQSTTPNARVLVYFHGNGENLEAIRRSNLLAVFIQRGFSVVAMDYPSLGRSTGFPNEANLVNSGLTVMRWADTFFGSAPLVIWGRSLGAAVAAQVAAKTEITYTGLILTSPWSTFLDVAKDKSGLASNLPKEWIEKHKYDTVTAAASIEVDTMIHHGDKDTVVPIKLGRKAFAGFQSGIASFTELTGLGHNDIFRSQTLWNDVQSFHAN